MRRRLVACGLAMGFGASAACAPSGFQSSTVVDSVRILASSADQPYAKPGATVNVQVRDTNPVGSGSNKSRFLRLRLTH